MKEMLYNSSLEIMMCAKLTKNIKLYYVLKVGPTGLSDGLKLRVMKEDKDSFMA